uniref:response regulator n=1 Tax=Nocardioides sp. TaxID=35761 RepID=UPI00286E9D18
LDVEMPRLSGIELIGQVRAHPTAGASRVLMLSGVTGRDSVLRARSEGADEYLSKPFRLGELSERVRSLIAQGPVGQVDSASQAALPPVDS